MRAGLELRPLRRKGSSGACSRSRPITGPRSPFLFTCQTAHVSSFPRRVFAPGFCFLGFAHPDEGWRSAEITLGCSGTRGACLNAARQTPCEASCVSRRRSPLGAPPWRFWAPVPRFLLRHLLRIRAASSSQPGRSARRTGSRGLPVPTVTSRLRRDATPRSIFGIVSGDAPHERGCAPYISAALSSQAQNELK